MSAGVFSRTVPLMGTLVTIQAIVREEDRDSAPDPDDAIERAFGWFHRVEACCTRFDEQSEVMQLTSQIGRAVPVSAMLFETTRFALTVAEESGGAFDPTIGSRMQARGFNQEHRTGRIVQTAIENGDQVSYRDVRLDPDQRTVTLLRPLVLDLGAVAKGLAVDMAARELTAFSGYAIDAGGDLFLGGCNADGNPWSVGIRHPRRDRELIDALSVSNQAVCTSGDYERRSPGEDEGHHIIDPRTGVSPASVASATVVAPTAMLADALVTAAFVLGPVEGIQLIERYGLEGLIVSASLERFTTKGLNSDVNRHAGAIAG